MGHHLDNREFSLQLMNGFVPQEHILAIGDDSCRVDVVTLTQAASFRLFRTDFLPQFSMPPGP